MNDPIETVITLAPGQLRALSERQDGPSVRHAVASLGVLSAGLLLAYVPGSPAPALGVVGAGLMTGAMFPPFHEALHGTVFRSRRANNVFAAITGFFQVAGPTAYRAFHLQHHRASHSPDDPEISPALALLTDWATNPVTGLTLFSGVPILFGKLIALITTVLLPTSVLKGPSPYLVDAEVGRMRLEAVIVLSLHALAAWALGWTWPLLFVIGHLGMGPFLACEHTGLPMAGSVVMRTRSMAAPALVRWFAWNMNLHAEHHGWPSVPWWQLPALSESLGDRLPHRTTYPAVWAEAARAWMGRRDQAPAGSR